MSAVLVDTGFLVALLDRDESYHHRCKEVLSVINSPLVSCEAVIAESCYLLRNIKGAVDSILKNVSDNIIHVAFDLSHSSERVRELMKKYSKTPMDFADGCLVCMAEELDTGRILTLDNDFSYYRWSKSKKFEMLLQEAE